MGAESTMDVDAWLLAGGTVVAASERAARWMATKFHRARQAEGHTAWPTPAILDWHSFLRGCWDRKMTDDRVVLNPLQEQALWTRLITQSAPAATAVAGTAERLGALAMEAHHLLCNYAPQLLHDKARIGWDRDAGAFSSWLAAFNKLCGDSRVISEVRLPMELSQSFEPDFPVRPPLLLAGFDRILPVQRRFFSAWGADDFVREIPVGSSASNSRFYAADDPASELAACALWAKAQLAKDPRARLLLVTQDMPECRGEIERAFHRFSAGGLRGSAGASMLEFSLGAPLGQVELGRAAILLLRWLNGAIAENELDWLLATGLIAASQEEFQALPAVMRELRRRGLQRPNWTLAQFLRRQTRAALPPEWAERMKHAARRAEEFERQPRSAHAWADFAAELLHAAGWPGYRPLESAEYQVLRRWQQVLDNCASLGFDGYSMRWSEFIAVVERVANDTLFAPESEGAPILVAGPAESAGLEADGIWFLGVSEERWPQSGSMHPLLPTGVQRDAGMPHSSAKFDWNLAAAITHRLLASAPEVHFSYARQTGGVEARASRIVTQLVGTSRELGPELIATPAPVPEVVNIEDAAQIPYPFHEVSGGAAVLTAQSRCPFRAFATSRLSAEQWQAAETGLNAQERGLLLHEVLHSIWAGPPNGIRTHAELADKADRLESFVETHVRRVLGETMPERAREDMPARYLEIEATRLIGLLSEWLRYESARVPFAVAETECSARSAIAGLELKVRLDRIDRLGDGSLLVIDYKTGLVSPQSWDLPRPDDVQLPLYASFGLSGKDKVGGLVFARIRSGKSKEFAGRVRQGQETLMASLGAQTSLVKRPLLDSDLGKWRLYVEQMARDYLAGCAVAEPRDYPKTCDRCGLEALCRIQENAPQLAEDGNGEEETYE